MSYAWESQHIKLGTHDRRLCKLTPNDKIKIKQLHDQGIATRELARRYEDKCSRRTITFIIYPERLAHLQKLHKDQKHWKKYYDKERNANSIRKWRQHKNKLIKQNIIK